LMLERAHIAGARLLLVTLPDPLATRQIVELARGLAPELEIVARTRSEAERQHLARHGRVEGVLAELETAIEIARHTLLHFGASQIEAQAIALDLRRGVFTPRDGARVLEVRIDADAPAVGRTLAELALGRGVLVMAIDRAGDLLVPDGQTRLEAGDLVLLVAQRDRVEHVQNVL
jgi:CPA2 family monovalent cation:H+ antiporter-2